MAQKKTSLAYAQALLELSAEPWLKGLRQTIRRLREGDLAARLEDPACRPRDKRPCWRRFRQMLPPQVAAFYAAWSTMASSISWTRLSVSLSRSSYGAASICWRMSGAPFHLTDDEREQLEENLAQRFGSNLESGIRVDPALMGGVVVRVGDEVIDGSLAGKLAALRERFAARQPGTPDANAE